jgi:hypothetical protein
MTPPHASTSIAGANKWLTLDCNIAMTRTAIVERTAVCCEYAQLLQTRPILTLPIPASARSKQQPLNAVDHLILSYAERAGDGSPHYYIELPRDTGRFALRRLSATGSHVDA